MSGKVSHFEIPFDDAERAYRFYREAFGWMITDMAEMDYTMVSTGPTMDDGQPTDVGYIGGGMFKREAQLDRPVITIVVDDLAESLAKVVELGGHAVIERQEVGGFGLAAYVKDSEGNLIGLWQDLTPES